MTVLQPEFTPADYQHSAQTILEAAAHSPRIALILGSGLGSLVESIEQPSIIPYSSIPNWPETTIEGHSGQLVIGLLEGQAVMTMQGRAHYYEGYSMAAVTYPVRVMQQLGINILIVTNAAGGIDPTYRAGDLMLIKDHINFPGIAGHNPLRGPNDPALGVRFPDMSTPYDQPLRQLAKQVANKAAIALHEGVYASVAGPSFETPAEIRMLHLLGANAVGMSTAPEVIAARHAGIRVLGISGISNSTTTETDTEAATDHEEVLEIGAVLVPKLAAIVRGVLKQLPGSA